MKDPLRGLEELEWIEHTEKEKENSCVIISCECFAQLRGCEFEREVFWCSPSGAPPLLANSLQTDIRVDLGHKLGDLRIVGRSCPSARRTRKVACLAEAAVRGARKEAIFKDGSAQMLFAWNEIQESLASV